MSEHRNRGPSSTSGQFRHEWAVATAHRTGNCPLAAGSDPMSEQPILPARALRPGSGANHSDERSREEQMSQ
jgi:hypothetical protein